MVINFCNRIRAVDIYSFLQEWYSKLNVLYIGNSNYDGLLY